jgi:alkanesulfonate monooxygenase SsuD/methylene tetrahydromethanopterin reductase-like flavin-dependent oxidoreductase (luciferase family)
VKTLRLGVAATPVYTRTPAVLAATANAIGQLLPAAS